MIRIILTISLAAFVVACGSAPVGEKRADVSFEFQQTDTLASAGNIAKIITGETGCISISSNRDANAHFAAGFSGAKANGTINVPEGVNKFTLSSYNGPVDANDATKCTGDLHERFSVDANIVAGEVNTLVLHPLRASWNTAGSQAFDPHSLESTHATIDPFAVQFASLDFEQDKDPYSGTPVRNSYDVHIAYDTNTLTLPTGTSKLLPQFSESAGATSTEFTKFYKRILFDTEQYSGLYSLCSPYPGLTDNADGSGCNLRVKAVPDVRRANGDLTDGGLTLVSNLGVYSVESGIALLSIGFDPCQYITHESTLSKRTCSYSIVDSTGADITNDVRDKFKSTVTSGASTDEMSIHFVELKVHPPLSTTNLGDSFALSASEIGAPSPALAPSTGIYSFADPYFETRNTVSTVQGSTASDVVCYNDSKLVITTVTNNPLSPNYGKSGFDPQIAKSTNLKVDICGKEDPVALLPSPSRISVTQSGVASLNLVPAANTKSEGTFTYTKANQAGTTVMRDKGTFLNLVATDYFDASLNSLGIPAPKLGADAGVLSFMARPTNTVGSPAGGLDALALTSYSYDIAAAKRAIPEATAVRFWLYDYLDLYTIDATESGGVTSR